MSSFFSTKTEGCIRLSKRKYRLLITIALILSIIALVIAIVGMSLGFAAFSATLNISSSASVTPDSGSFYLGFYPSTTSTLDDALIAPTTSGGATGSSVTLSSGSTTI